MALVPYTKPHLPVAGQISLLKSRGMAISDDAVAAACLRKFGYYRLSGYWYPLRRSMLRATPDGTIFEVLDTFRPGAEMRHAVDLCIFDKRLRLLLSDAIERIEVALRVEVAHLLGARNPWAHLDPAELHGNFTVKTNQNTGITKYQEWIAKLNAVEGRSKEDFVKHFRNKYSSQLPIWISIEVWEFGMLSVFVDGMKVSDKEQLAAKCGIPRWELLTSWLRSLNHIRNICAHHGRLWNRSPSDQPKLPRAGEIQDLDHLVGDTLAQTRLYAAAATMQFLLRSISPQSAWAARLRQHVTTFPEGPGVVFSQSGFPTDWDTLPLWQ